MRVGERELLWADGVGVHRASGAVANQPPAAVGVDALCVVAERGDDRVVVALRMVPHDSRVEIGTLEAALLGGGLLEEPLESCGGGEWDVRARVRARIGARVRARAVLLGVRGRAVVRRRAPWRCMRAFSGVSSLMPSRAITFFIDMELTTTVSTTIPDVWKRTTSRTCWQMEVVS